jgi:hypothetical protein
MSEKKATKKPTEQKPLSTVPEPKKGDQEKLDPVRYGDWEKNGRCIDF